MSNPTNSSTLSNTMADEIRTGPHHHVHRDDEPLPGSRGGATTMDYTPETMDHTKLPPTEEGDTQDFHPHPMSHGNDFTSSQHNTHSPSHIPEMHDHGEHAGPMGMGSGMKTSHVAGDNVHDGTASGTGHAGMAKKPTMGDKLVGKTEELAGKIVRNQGLQEKGALRTHGEK